MSTPATDQNPDAPLVSIIVPAYNAAGCIGHTIRSVQAQTHENWEMLITDDGSTDGTAEAVEAAAAADPRVRLFRFEKNTGLAAKARNNSMVHAHGEFVAFLDADDEWKPDKLEMQLAYLRNHPEAQALCSWYYVFGDEERVRQFNSMMWRFGSPRVTLDQMLQQCIFTSTVIMRRAACEALGGMDESPELRSGQDYEYFMRLVAGHETHRLAEETTGYRLAPFGTSLSSARHSAQQRRQREIDMLRIFKEKQILPPGLLKKRRAIMYYNLSRDSLFLLNLPFRGDLWRSVRTGVAPAKANVMFALSFLPAPLLRKVLVGLLRLKNSAGRKGRN